MKKLQLLFLALICVLTTSAQSTSNWRLTKKAYKGPGWTEVITYSYDSKWQLKEVKQVQDNKPVQVLKNFTYNAGGKATGYEEENIGGGSPKTFTFVYDTQGRLYKKSVQHFKDGKENFKTISTFSYAANKITATKEILTKRGNATVVSEYQLDDRGNVLVNISDMKSPDTDTRYKNYDDTKNPLLFTGSLIDKDLLSPNNPKEMSFSGTSKMNLVVKKNASGLVTAIEEHSGNGAYKIMNGHTYSYMEMKK
jgi:hypothetical protein